MSRPQTHEYPLLLAIFLDLVGFGMAFPDIQLRAEAFGAPGWQIGLLLSSYFLVQMAASPRWGILSDRVGRKPVLLACQALSAASMLVYAFASGLGGILVSRVFAGLAAANVVVAQAYIADTHDEASRAAGMGRVGAAISAGLIAGPAIGGWLAEAGGNWLLGIVAASAAGLSFLWIALGVPHRQPAEERQPGKRPIVDLSILKDVPSLTRWFVIAASAWFALACLEGTFGRLIKHNLGFGQWEFGLIFSYESLLSVIVQGFVLGWVVRRLKEPRALRWAYLLQGVGLAATPFAPNLAALFVASTLFSLGTGVANPTINTLCSEATPKQRQGEMFGLLQAARSAGFLLGPAIGGIIFDWNVAAPYLLAGGVCLGALLLVPARHTASASSFSP